MHHSRSWALALSICATSIHAPSGRAQMVLGGRADLTIGSRYVWRGLSTGRPELTFGMLGSASRARSYTSLGIWAMGLPLGVQQSDSNRVGSDPSRYVPLENELDIWLEHARIVGPLRVALGGTYYFYNEFAVDPGNPASIQNTAEVYARIEHSELNLGSVNIVPKIGVWYDVDHIRGAYLETSVTTRLPIVPNSGIYLGALAGWSAGQAVDSNQTDRGGYFASNGLTHVDFSMVLPGVRFKTISYGLAIHYQMNVDDFTRMRDNLDGDKRGTLWASLAISHTF